MTLPYNLMEFLFSHFIDESKFQGNKITSSEVMEPLSDGLEFELWQSRFLLLILPSLHCTQFPEPKESSAAARARSLRQKY